MTAALQKRVRYNGSNPKGKALAELLEALRHWVLKIIEGKAISFGDGFEAVQTPAGIAVRAIAKGGGGTKIKLAELTEELGSGGQAKATLVGSGKEVTVHEVMGFAGDALPVGGKIFVVFEQQSQGGSKQWLVLNASGRPGCKLNDDSDCECEDDDEECECDEEEAEEEASEESESESS